MRRAVAEPDLHGPVLREDFAGATDLADQRDEFVGIAATQCGIADDAFKFRIEKLVALVPVDIVVDPGEEERQKGLKILLNRLFPGAVIVGADCRPGLCSRLGLGGLGFGGG